MLTKTPTLADTAQLSSFQGKASPTRRKPPTSIPAPPLWRALDAIGPEAFASAPLFVVGTMATSGQSSDTIGTDVTSAVSAYVAARGRSQYRLAFASPTDLDGLPDILVIDWSSLTLALTYRLP